MGEEVLPERFSDDFARLLRKYQVRKYHAALHIVNCACYQQPQAGWPLGSIGGQWPAGSVEGRFSKPNLSPQPRDVEIRQHSFAVKPHI